MSVIVIMRSYARRHRISRRGMRRKTLFRGPLACLAAVSMVAAVLVGVLPAAAYASGTTPALMPAAGQFFPVSPVEALDTRSGAGGVAAAPLASEETVTFPIDGVGGVPANGVSDVLVSITAFGPSQSGALEDFDG